MSGVAYGKVLTIFQGAKQHIFDTIDRNQVVVHMNKCIFSHNFFIEYHFDTQEYFDQFIKESEWNDLPSVNMHDHKYFNVFEDGKFHFKKGF